MSSASKKQKTYHFHWEWEECYFFTEFKGKSVCLLCNANVAVGKKGNIERHYKTVHSTIEKSFPSGSAVRKEKVRQLKSQLLVQQSFFTKTTDRNKAATEASYRVANIIAKRKKPFEDGEMIKEAFIEASDALFDNFKNKAEIMAAVKSIQLSANTVMRRVEVMSDDVVSQLKSDFDKCSYFSLQLDESTDVVDTAQLAVFVKTVFDDFTTKEEIVKFIPLTGHTTGQDIFSEIKTLISTENIPICKLVGLTTDGAPAMVGDAKGFVAFCRRDGSFPQFVNYHCIIHQQALCGKFLKFNNVMKLVVKTVNKVRAHALQRRLFKALTDELDCQYGDLLLHNEVRWLSRGRVLQRFKDLLSALVQFFKERGEPIPELEDSVWLKDFAFLVDITDKLNELNFQLQGKNKDLGEMISDVQAFSRKLELWEINLARGDVKHFPTLKEQLEKQGSSHSFCCRNNSEIISNLRVQFQKRFQDFKKIELLVQFITSPFMDIDTEEFSNCVIQHFQEDGPAAEMELIAFQSDLSLKSVVSSSESIWPLVSKEKYPVLVRVALRVKALFSSTYLCEASFSNMKVIKNKFRNRLTDKHLDNCIRMAVTNYSPNIKRIVAESECHVSYQ